ncbi:MAG: site-specific integrase [Castellaniella sp.]|uniref:tyrosine-type recombinase/integrase n=1 Tax=Castellaniella sp. TaxID=1955812 RepID=UPI00121554C9|nr:site-specific integrase [Castellaniella sp.]TAN29986.1 MAG: site-specific integrase [Castellaniella sp.]
MTTRYPKAGKGGKWTIRELQSIPTDWHGDTLSDGEGLSGEVRVAKSGKTTARFKYAFRWQNKVAWFQCGTWPTVDLAEIRSNRDAARDKVKAGVNPSTDKAAAKIEAQAEREAVIAQKAAADAERKTVRDLYNVWIVDGVARKDGNKELKRLFNKDVLPELGSIELRKLVDTHILALLRKVAARTNGRLTVVIYRGVTQMLLWAEQRKPWRGLLVDGNPAKLIDVENLLPDDYEEERDRVLSVAEIRELADIFTRMREDYEAAPAGAKYEAVRPLKPESELAIWICLGTLCRIGELLMAEWSHVDLEARTWFIPRANVKGQRKQKQDLMVYLSDFSCRQFTRLKELTGKSRWLFPGRNAAGKDLHVCLNSVSKQIGDRQIRFKNRKQLSCRRHDNTLVLADGAKGEWTPHDLRRTGATMMQSLRIPLEIIDHCQNHVIKGAKTRRHYFHWSYKEEKREAWTALGNRLDAILTGGAEVIPLTRSR